MSFYADKREQDRADRAEQARLEIERAAAMAPFQLQARQQELAAQEQTRAEARAINDARRAARVDAVKQAGRAVAEDGLMTPVLLAGAVLSWLGMAAFGDQVYGPLGNILPLFSEGLLLSFALRARQARRRGEPLGRIMAGLAFAAVTTAAMQVVHGLSGEHGSWTKAAIMAAVSVAGVVADQIVHAAPRLARAERIAARREAELAAQVADRMRAMRAAAIAQAPARLAADGTVELVFEPGLVTLTGTRGKRRIEPVTPVTHDDLDVDYQRLLAGLTPADQDLVETPQDTPYGRVSGVTAAGESPDAPGGGTALATRPKPAGNDIAEWVKRALEHVVEGELTLGSSQRQIREVLGCRMVMAARVQHALRKHQH
uniref:hypothetical protein n=1 Tax=Actinokineospora sp. CA-119265 TaxID=3239890 RepID=UPI003F498D28